MSITFYRRSKNNLVTVIILSSGLIFVSTYFYKRNGKIPKPTEQSFIWNHEKTTQRRLSDNGTAWNQPLPHVGTIDTEAVDVVYTWVNGSDLQHQDMVKAFSQKSENVYLISLAANRFEPWNNLLYSLRSVDRFANWIRQVFIVTNGQIPAGINFQNPNITLVTHQEIFPNQSHLPTFASRAIESHLHRIKGLASHFIYLNDDFFFASPVTLEDYYTARYGYKMRFETYTLPDCASGCTPRHVNNGQCDQQCFKKTCEWDGEDCPEATIPKNNREDNSDTWIPSMLHTNYQLNKLYEPRIRGVPIHAPIFINRNVLTDLQERLPAEWDFTSSCRLKHPHTMQFPFAYCNYVMELSYPNPPVVKAESVSKSDASQFFLTSNVTRSRPGLSSFQRTLRQRNIKFFNVADNVEEASADVKQELRQLLEDFFVSLFPTPSQYEIIS